MIDHTERTFWDRIGVAAVVVLLAAFIVTATGPLVSLAGGDPVSGMRDDGIPFAAVAVADDDDDDGNSNSGAGTRSGEASIGSHSGNTKTGTTAGTGKSATVSESRHNVSANTATGTTRNTGGSQTVSNSS